jgi:hypothetical protein
MENRERTCLLHWTTLLIRYTQKNIKPDLQDQHNRLCKQYKDSKTMEEAESRYLAIRAWWFSSGAASEDAIRDLNLWLAFWHFRYRQWGGFMQMVSSSSLVHLVILNHVRMHICIVNYIFFPLVSRTECRRDGKHTILQLVGNCPQQVASIVW